MGISALYKGKEVEENGIDLSDIDVFQRQYNEHYRALKYFGLRYLPDEEAVSDWSMNIPKMRPATTKTWSRRSATG